MTTARPLKTIPSEGESLCRVRDLREGDLVDLESCPHLHGDPLASFEYAQVLEIAHEGPECIAVDYVSGGAGYSPDALLVIKTRV